jgi:hypothetical protein
MPYSPVEFHSLDSINEKILPKPSSDVWSLGIILYELFNCRMPIKYIRFMHRDVIKMW